MKTKVMYKGKLISLSNLFDLLKAEFKDHIGEENGITLVELLDTFFPENKDWTVWKQYTYMDVMKKAIGVVRRQHGVFIVNQKGNIFVIKRQEEADRYKDILRKDIVGMKKSIIKADMWVQEERWKSYAKS